jgi:hypothetical protein
MTGRNGADVLRAVAAHGLAGADVPLVDEPLDDEAWNRLLARVTAERLQGQLAAAVSVDALPTTHRQREETAQTHAAAMATCLALDRLLCDIDAEFEAAHIPMRVLKGSSFAHLDYGDPAVRAYGDVDVLVPSKHLEQAVAVLLAAGCHRQVPELRPGFDRRFAKSLTLAVPDGYEIDLHRTLALEPFGLGIDTDDLWDAGEPFVVGGRTLLALPAEQRLLHACYHAALDNNPPRLLPLRDVAQLVLEGVADPDRVLVLADRWGGAAAVAQAIQLAWSTFGVSDVVHLSEWAKRYRPGPKEARTLLVHTAIGRRHAQKAMAALSFINGVETKAAYLRALLFPQREFLRQRGVGHGAWLRQGTRSLLGGRSHRRRHA